MDPFILGIGKLLIDKGTAALPILGFLVALYLLREGLALARSYIGEQNADRGKLLAFIQTTQARQDAHEQGFLSTLGEIQKNLAVLNQQGQRDSETATERYNEVRTRLQTINRDIWESRNGPRPS